MGHGIIFAISQLEPAIFSLLFLEKAKQKFRSFPTSSELLTSLTSSEGILLYCYRLADAFVVSSRMVVNFKLHFTLENTHELMFNIKQIHQICSVQICQICSGTWRPWKFTSLQGEVGSLTILPVVQGNNSPWDCPLLVTCQLLFAFLGWYPSWSQQLLSESWKDFCGTDRAGRSHAGILAVSDKPCAAAGAVFVD